MRIILDAMGSDNHPLPEIQAAVEAAKIFGDEITLVGDENRLALLLKENNPERQPVKLLHAPDVFEMTDKIAGPGELRRAMNSMGVGMDLLSNGNADALVTAGNTGGALAIGLARLGRIKGVKRPALTAPFPTKGGTTILADIGANAQCKPEYLLQFALMASIYAEKMLGKVNPRVGLISNGEEEGKGNDLVRETFPLLQNSNLNFVGNIEGKEFFGGEVDVAVTDGFTGNVLLKSSEAVAKLLIDELRSALMKNARTKAGALLAKPAFEHLRAVLDPGAIGAVPLLGLDGLVFVGHGRSDARALVSAIRTARAGVESKLLGALRLAIQEG
jgi:glycerol-3-phosphate acyltransferase PlsX